MICSETVSPTHVLSIVSYQQDPDARLAGAVYRSKTPIVCCARDEYALYVLCFFPPSTLLLA